MARISLLSGSQGVRSIDSVKSHPRYRLRMIAIGSVAFGVFFNILSIAICKQYILNGLAFIPLIISMIWHHVDLVAPYFYKRSLGAYAFVDVLGFCSFLALLIANGIITAHMYNWRVNTNGRVILMTYTSVPWISCCAMHGFIALHDIFQSWTACKNGLSVCPDCSRSWKGEHVKPGEASDRAHYSLLGQKDDHEYNVEADADATYSDGGNTGGGNNHMPAASDETA
ncbi:hypothetical protein MMC07_003502 [Pseudocyphellaria aurata]|nr:hypothetical protein [Pseudocyphellaria aurata]